MSDVTAYHARYGRVPESVRVFMRKDGDGTHEMAADYSVTPGTYYLAAGPEDTIEVTRIMLYAQGDGALAATTFATEAALDPGLAPTIRRADNTTKDLTDGVPITTNASIAQHCYDSVPKQWGAGDNGQAGRWTFEHAVPEMLYPGDRIEVVLSEDLSEFTTFTIKVEGVLLHGPTRFA